MRVPQRIAVAFVACTMVIGLAGAAPAQKAQKKAAVPPAVLLEKLDLTADQQGKLDTATAAYRAETKKVAGVTGKEKRQRTKQARLAYDAAIRSVLTDDQEKSLAAMMQEAEEYRGLGPMGARLVGLNLSAEQKSRIRQIAARHAPELEKLKAERKAAADKKSVRPEIRRQQQQMMSEVRAVLTPQQANQLRPAGNGRKRKA
jgi:hypothetical protein